MNSELIIVLIAGFNNGYNNQDFNPDSRFSRDQSGGGGGGMNPRRGRGGRNNQHQSVSAAD